MFLLMTSSDLTDLETRDTGHTQRTSHYVPWYLPVDNQGTYHPGQEGRNTTFILIDDYSFKKLKHLLIYYLFSCAAVLFSLQSLFTLRQVVHMISLV